MYISIITTSNCKKTIERISQEILNNNLSPCIQVQDGIRSLFKWNNKVKEENEFILTIKTISTFKDKITNIINEYHNYDIPEIIFTSINIINDDYKNWFDKNLKL